MIPLDRPVSYGGIGSGFCEANYKTQLFGCLENGMLFPYTADVLDGKEGDEAYTKPALYGMDRLRETNCYIGCRRDTMHLVPPGLEAEIVWPEGTVELQCERAQSGHMMLVLSHWNHFDAARNEQKQKEASAKQQAAVTAFQERQKASF